MRTESPTPTSLVSPLSLWLWYTHSHDFVFSRHDEWMYLFDYHPIFVFELLALHILPVFFTLNDILVLGVNFIQVVLLNSTFWFLFFVLRRGNVIQCS